MLEELLPKLDIDEMSPHLLDPRFLPMKAALLYLLQHDLLMGGILTPCYSCIEDPELPLPVNLWLTQQHAVLHIIGEDHKGHAVVWDAHACVVRDPSSTSGETRSLASCRVKSILPITELT